MRTENVTSSAIRIFDAPKLDPICLILLDAGGCGHVIVECYGESWATYFSAIGSRSLASFLAGVHPEYLSNRMARNRENKTDAAYRLRICAAVVEACANLEQPA